MEPLSSRRCAACGAAAQALLTTGSEAEPRCLSCLDRGLPAVLPGNLVRLMTRHRRRDGACPHCGWTEAQMRDTALCGCPLCYEALNIALLNVENK